MKLKMCITGKTFGKICLKTIRDIFFQHLVSNQRRDRVKHEGNGGGLHFSVGSDIQQKGGVQNFGYE